MKTIVIHPYLKKETGNRRTPEARLEEAVRLTHAIWWFHSHSTAPPP
jgi:hypothetical protein